MELGHIILSLQIIKKKQIAAKVVAVPKIVVGSVRPLMVLVGSVALI